MENNDLLEPRKFYNSSLKREHKQNVEDFFEELTKKSNVDLQANKLTTKKYYELVANIKNQENAIKRKKGLKVILIVMFVIFLLTGLILIICGATNNIDVSIGILIGIVSIILGIGLLLLEILKVKPAIKSISSIINKLTKEADSTKAEAYVQMAPLNALFDWNMHTYLAHKTLPLLEMDSRFDVSKHEYLVNKFGFDDDNNSTTSSTEFVQSGSILGNPFLIQKNHIQTMGTYTYIGHLTISYTVRVPNGKGGYTTSTRTQVLTASVVKPKPYYKHEIRLIYGCEAAPNLSYSRIPSGVKDMNDKQIEKYISKTMNEIDKKSIKGITNGFTPIGNPEFESLLKALNRDNEVEFRLLYTPLAQKNIVDLIKSKEPFGDDFKLIKNKMINTVVTQHAQLVDYECNPESFEGFDYEAIKENFVKTNVTYFESLFFDFAPLFCVPLYHQLPSDEYIFEKKFHSNITSLESETMANKFNSSVFQPEECVTPLILKSNFVAKDGKADRVNIVSYGFKTIEHVDFVPTMGGDGNLHSVPVHWLEYIPVDKATPMEVQEHNINRSSYLEKINLGKYKNFFEKNVRDNAIICQRGLVSFIPCCENNYDYNELDNLLK